MTDYEMARAAADRIAGSSTWSPADAMEVARIRLRQEPAVPVSELADFWNHWAAYGALPSACRDLRELIAKHVSPRER